MPIELSDTIPIGPPVSTSGPPVSSTGFTSITADDVHSVDSKLEQNGPQKPIDGLPDGWTIEQWQYYGQQYLDTKQ